MSRLSDELRGRCKAFASQTIRLYTVLPKQQAEAQEIGKQLLRTGIAVAAYSREASRARSDAEFCGKLDGLIQAADEAQLWLELLRDDCNIDDPDLYTLLNESGELMAIFTSIVTQIRRRTDGLRPS